MAGQIRTVYGTEPTFPATDQHPDAVRYVVAPWWIDAIGGQPTQQEVTAFLAPLLMPDFGSDVDSESEWRASAITAVTNLRAYLALPSPTNAQTVAAFKLLVRVVLFLVRRAL